MNAGAASCCVNALESPIQHPLALLAAHATKLVDLGQAFAVTLRNTAKIKVSIPGRALLMTLPYSPRPIAVTTVQPRPRVTRHLEHALRQPICVLAAATGYGKTIAARQVWDEFTGRKAWWTALDGKKGDDLQAAAKWAWHDTSALESPSVGCGDSLPATLRLLVIDLADSVTASGLWTTIADLAEQMPASARLLLLTRSLPAQPCTRWRIERRLQVLDHSVLALDTEEWDRAGLASAGSCTEGAGWWGPAAWLAASQGAWRTSLADWVAEVWFPTLPLLHRTLLGRLSLLPDNVTEVFAALHEQDCSDMGSCLRELCAVCGVVWSEHGRAGVSPQFRMAIADAWRKTDTAAWTDALLTTLAAELSHNRLSRAAQLADEAGPGPARRMVLQGAGLHMLYSRERAILGRWLAVPLDLGEPALRVLRAAWLVEVEKTAHLADAELRSALTDGRQQAQVMALQATIALDYDECERAELLATAALDAFDDDRHPLSIRAHLTRGSARAVLGRLDQAAADLLSAHLCAEREQLIWLQLDSLLRRSRLASKQGRRAQALSWLQQALELARDADLQHSSAGDSCRRQQAWLHLEMLDAPAARQAREAARPFWDFPQQVHLAVEALLEDRIADARRAAKWLMLALETNFQPRKWQNQAAWIGIWLAGHENDEERLLYWERHLTSRHGSPDVQSDRGGVLLAGVRCLLGREYEHAALTAQLARLQEQGAGALALQMRLVIALQDGHEADFLACLEEGARQQAYLDYLWLGPRVAPLLQQALSAAHSGCNPELHAFVRHLLQRLLAPVPAVSVSAEVTVPGLTAKETQILRLIGQHYKNEQIAAGLFISLATVKTHINRIYSKLGFNDRSEAIRFARQRFM